MRRQLTTLLLSALSIPLLLAADMRAQKVPLAADDERIVQLHDVRALLAKTDPEPEATDDVERRRRRVARLEEFVRTFMSPQLGGDEDVQALGTDHLVMLARPPQQAWLERLLAHHRRAGSYHITLTVRILTVPKGAFAAHFAPLFGVRDTWTKLQAVQPAGEATDRWLAAIAADATIQTVQAPRLLAAPLQRASIQVGKTIRYVKDYEIETVRERSVAVPIMAETFDGARVEMTSGLVDEKRLGVTFDFRINELKSMPKFETTLRGVPEKVTVDLPTWTELHLEQKIVIPDGGTAIVSAPDNDTYAVALVTAETIPM